MTELRVSQVRMRIGSELSLFADFKVGSGERLGVVGRSGSGKTTLLRIIAGLEVLDGEGDSGEVSIGADRISHLPPEKRGVGMVFQDQALFPTLSVLENAGFGLRMRGVKLPEREAIVVPWLERLGLGNRLHSDIATLSGGERQRVAFVRAVAWKPRLLALDEPFSALDLSLRQVLRKELVDLHRLWPVPMLFVTHDEADLLAVATERLEVDEATEHGVSRFIRI